MAAPSVEPIGPDLSMHRGCKWDGGVLGRDGCFYAIPYNATRVLRIDPAATGDAAVLLIGPDLSTHGGHKWIVGVLGSDGCIYAIPYNASRVLRIDPAAPGDAAVELIGPDFRSHGGYKWNSGVLGSDGCIYANPYYASRVLRIDPAAPVRPARSLSERLRDFARMGSSRWGALTGLLLNQREEAGRRPHLVGAEHVPLDVRDLHEAAAGNDLQTLLRHILSSDHLSPSSVRAITPAGRTPLHTASAAGAVHAVRILVQTMKPELIGAADLRERATGTCDGASNSRDHARMLLCSFIMFDLSCAGSVTLRRSAPGQRHAAGEPLACPSHPQRDGWASRGGARHPRLRVLQRHRRVRPGLSRPDGLASRLDGGATRGCS